MKFTTDNFRKPCGCRSVGECLCNDFAEVAALDALVDAFATEMKKKLRKQLAKGHCGWDDDTPDVKRNLHLRLSIDVARHLRGESDQSVDIANFAAMLWNQAQPATEREADHG